jgi:hypothetical protein
MATAGAVLAATASGGWYLGNTRGKAAIMVLPSTPPPTVQAPSAQPSMVASPSIPPVPTVDLAVEGWVSWALLDRVTGDLFSSENSTEQNNTASMIKSWLAADYLRRMAERNSKPSADKLSDLSEMIRDSENAPASEVFAELGRSATISRMNALCGTSASAGDGFGRTQMSAQDACHLAHHLGSGTAAGPQWTDWLLNEMRNVRGDGDFGIRKAFPQADQSDIAIKNGWDTWSPTDNWTVNCLALTQGWAMSVLTRYPENLGMEHGMSVTEAVASQLITTSRLL